MPTIIRFKDYFIYFTVKCLKEPIHIHINVGAPADDGNSAKIWVNSDGSLTIEHLGVFEDARMKKQFDILLEMAQVNVAKAVSLWSSKKGSIEYIDIVGRFNVNQND